jgi:hypothetical protein
VHGKALRTGRKQEITSPGALQKRALVGAEMEGVLQLGGLTGPLGPKEKKGRVGRHDRALL